MELNEKNLGMGVTCELPIPIHFGQQSITHHKFGSLFLGGMLSGLRGVESVKIGVGGNMWELSKVGAKKRGKRKN